MIARLAQPLLLLAMDRAPAILLVGPRQAGKTTLAKRLTSSYYDLELESERLRLDLEWQTVIESNALVALDEAQSMPEIFPRLRAAIDQDRKRNGRFLLLGSIAPSLMKQVAESLAGRISIYELSPLLLTELNTEQKKQHWLCGGFPDGGVLDLDKFPEWQSDYMTLLTQRDLPIWGFPGAAPTTVRLLRMIATLNGEPWNASKIGANLSLNYQTVNSYIAFLEEVFLLRKLEPYLPNIRKRLVKSPRVYLRDSGVLHSLLQISSMKNLLANPVVGKSWEGYVIEQIISTLLSKNLRPNYYYFQTSDEKELDLVLELCGKVFGFEIKLSSNPPRTTVSKLEESCSIIGADQGYLVCRSPEVIVGKEVFLGDLTAIIDHLLKQI